MRMKRVTSTWTTLSRCLLLVLVIALITAGVIHVNRNSLTVPGDEPEEEIYEASWPRAEALKVAKSPASNSLHEAKDKIPLQQEETAENASRDNPYAETIANAQRTAIALLDNKTGWKRRSGDSLDGEGLVYTRTVGGDTVFKLEGNIMIDVNTLYEDMVKNPGEVSTWNTNVVEQRVLERIDNSMDIIYSLAPKRIVSNRDFVFARHWEVKDGWFIVSTVSVSHPSGPEDHRYTRAEQKQTVMRMKEITPRKLRLEWLLHLDLKLNIPMMFVKPSLLGAMTTYLKDLRAHAATLLPNT